MSDFLKRVEGQILIWVNDSLQTDRNIIKIAACAQSLEKVVGLEVGLPYGFQLHLYCFSCNLLFHILVKRNNSFGE